MPRAEDPMLVIELIRFWIQLRNFICAPLGGSPRRGLGNLVLNLRLRRVKRLAL